MMVSRGGHTQCSPCGVAQLPDRPVMTHAVLKQVRPNDADIHFSLKFKACNRCENLIAPDLSSKNDRYRSHNSRCTAAKDEAGKPYVRSHRDVPYSRVYYDPDATDRHNKPLTDDNPVDEDKDGNAVMGFYHVEELTQLQLKQIVLQELQEQMAQEQQQQEEENFDENMPLPDIKPDITDAALMDISTSTSMEEVNESDQASEYSEDSSLSRSNSLCGGGIKATAALSTTSEATVEAQDGDGMFDRLEEEDDEEEIDTTTQETPMTAKWAETVENDLNTNVPNFVSELVGDAETAIKERRGDSQESNETLEHLKSLGKEVITSLAKLNEFMQDEAAAAAAAAEVEDGSFDDAEGSAQHDEAAAAAAEEEEKEEEEEEEASEPSSEFGPEHLAEIGADALMMSQPDAADIEDEDEQEEEEEQMTEADDVADEEKQVQEEQMEQGLDGVESAAAKQQQETPQKTYEVFVPQKTPEEVFVTAGELTKEEKGPDKKRKRRFLRCDETLPRRRNPPRGSKAIRRN